MNSVIDGLRERLTYLRDARIPNAERELADVEAEASKAKQAIQSMHAQAADLEKAIAVLEQAQAS